MASWAINSRVVADCVAARKAKYDALEHCGVERTS
jgi:hypothetical protein